MGLFRGRPTGLRWRSSTYFIVATVIVGLFSDIFLYSLFVPILPYMLEERAGISPEEVQSYVSQLLAAYAGASVLCSPFAGWIADRTESRQVPFLTGLAALLAGTLLLYVAPDMPLMVAARILQGVSSAVVWSVGLALCLDTVGPENMGKTTGTAFSATSVGGLVGPVVGGVLYEAAGYPGVFGLGAAVIIIDLGMRLLVVEKVTAQQWLDSEDNEDRQPSAERGRSGQPESGNQHARDEEETPLLGRSDSKQQDSEYRLPDNLPWLLQQAPLLACFRHAAFPAALFIQLIQATLIGTLDATVPTTAQSYFGFSPLQAGLLFIPLSLADVLVGPAAGWFVDRYGTKLAAVLGSLLLVPGFACLRFVHPGGTDQIVRYSALLALIGGALSATGSPPLVEASNVVTRYNDANPQVFGPRGPFAKLYGLSSMVFNLGLTIGPLAGGALRDSLGYGTMNAVTAGLCSLAAVISFVYIGSPPSAVFERLRSYFRYFCI